jgi:beta-lactamase class A
VVAVPSAVPPVRGAPADPALARRIDALLAGRPGRYSVVVMTPAGAPLYSRLPDAQVEAASLYKLAIMVEAYRQREAGWLDFAEELTLDPAFFLEDAGEWYAVGGVVPVETLLEAMVVDSSNVAAAALLHRVGRDHVNATMANLGLASTEIRWTPRVGGVPSAANDSGVYNVTSAADMARLFRLLLAGEVVSAEASSAMLDLLVHQAINDRLPAALPAGAVVAHKTGNLPGLVHDAGVIYTPTGPLVVAALSEGVDEGEAAEVLARLGALVYRAAE